MFEMQTLLFLPKLAQNLKCKTQSSSPGFMLTASLTFGQRVLLGYYSYYSRGHGEYSINGFFSPVG